MNWDFALTIANIASAVGMFVFAGMQWWLTRRHEEVRRAEREADTNASLAAAYGTLWAECQRFHIVRNELINADWIVAAVRGELRADDLLPRDWATMTQMLGQLGLETAEFGAALTHAFSIKRAVEDFIS